MKTLVTLHAVVFIIVSMFFVSMGLDLRKWQSWLLGIYAFFTFFLVGLAGTGNISEAIKAGGLVSFLLTFGGAVMNWNRKHAEKQVPYHGHDKNKK